MSGPVLAALAAAAYPGRSAIALGAADGCALGDDAPGSSLSG
jgi:hypothetical protein